MDLFLAIAGSIIFIIGIIILLVWIIDIALKNLIIFNEEDEKELYEMLKKQYEDEEDEVC